MADDPPARRLVDDSALQERRHPRARIGLLNRYAFGIRRKAINTAFGIDVFGILF
jgi:hypothetical protein